MEAIFTDKSALVNVYHQFLEAVGQKDEKKLTTLASKALV